jgi:hypothetical protein
VNKKIVIVLLFCAMLSVMSYAGRTAAQNPFGNVDILVVDDFSNRDVHDIAAGAYDPDTIAEVFAEAGYPEGHVEDMEGVQSVVDRLIGLINEESLSEYVYGDVFEDNCVINVEAQGHARAGMIGGRVSNHGELVEALLDEQNSNFGLGIPIERVPTEGLTTGTVANRIMDTVSMSPYPYHVINMSFVIVPCSLADDFARYQLLLEYSEDFGDIVMFQAALDAMTQFANTLPPINENDPLWGTLAEFGPAVIPVASAGNFGFAFPYFPGAWDNVIAVSGSDDSFNFVSSSGPYRDQYGASNAGEVMMPAVWQFNGVRAAGTSFAAPRLSFIMAVYLSQAQGDVCRGNGPHPTFADLGSPTTGWPDRNLVDAAIDVSCDSVLRTANDAGLPVP